MKREFTVIIERGHDGYLIASVPSVRGCATQGKDLTEPMENVKEALALCLEELGDEAEEPLELLGVYRVAV